MLTPTGWNIVLGLREPGHPAYCGTGLHSQPCQYIYIYSTGTTQDFGFAGLNTGKYQGLFCLAMGLYSDETVIEQKPAQLHVLISPLTKKWDDK